MRAPRVSVLLPAYHAGKYVDQTIESVAAQTLGDWEIVAVDDCSPDDTFERLLDWQRRDPRMRVRRNDKNRGVTGNWVECLRDARGELVIKIDADDIWRPRTLELLVEPLSDPDVIGAGVRTLLCSEEMEPFGAFAADGALMAAGLNPYGDHILQCERWFEIAARGHQLWAGDGMLVRRAVLLSAGGLDERFGCGSDSEMQWRLLGSSVGRFAHRAYVGVLYRMVETSISHESRRNNWLTWEGTVGNLIGIAAYGQRHPVPRWLRMRRADLWYRWEEFRCLPQNCNTLPPLMLTNLIDVMRSVPPPPVTDRLLWKLRQGVGRLVGP